MLPNRITLREKKENKRRPYKRPAVIYDGVINTRAGTPIGRPGDPAPGVDPDDLFGGNG